VFVSSAIELACVFEARHAACVLSVCTFNKRDRYSDDASVATWRSLGETAVNSRIADNSEGNRITCALSDTAEVYHRQTALVGLLHSAICFPSGDP
jgi:hypothetical protein